MRSERLLFILFLAAFLVMAAVSFERYSRGVHLDYYLYPAITCLVSAALLTLPIILRWKGTLTLPMWFISLIFLALFLHCVGVVERFYDDISWWDNLTHFLSSMLVSAMGFMAVYLVDWYVEEIYIPVKVMPFIIVAVGCSFGVLWEIMEWSADLVLATGMQYSLDDTMQDLLMDLLGAFTMGVLGWFFLHHRSPGELAQELGVEKQFSRLGAWWDERNSQ
ncbi:MAG: hypothetical protein PHW93_03350 [Candidatus Methanomethylophilaceae archaeon]|nr:hypothetical protein [Candidatus Methanomethylophilaceae archaeon]